MKMEKKAYIERMVRDLTEWSATIEEYEGRVSRSPVGLQTEYEQRIRNLKEKRDLLSSKLQELRESASGDSTDLEASVETAKHGLKAAFDLARDTMKKAA
jgi:uncharacterized coiled-coil DUF342 family protein